MDYLLTSLLIEISEQAIHGLKKTDNPKAGSGQLPKILEWIRIHSTAALSLHRVAREFNYSKEYLARYFKKNMGMSVHEYVNRMKVSKAKELLCESGASIKEIAGDLGFEDEKYFMKLFKRYEKVTPRTYRRAYSLTHLNNQ